MKLYKVKVETEIMVVADNEASAILVAKTNSADEVVNYGKCKATQVKQTNEIPDDWKSIIPYAPQGMMETKKCFELVDNTNVPKRGLEKEEIDHIIKIQETKRDSVIINEIKPETRSDPKPKEMDWHDTKSGRPLPKLRFIK